MKKRYRQQQAVKSDRAPYPYPRSQQQARAPRETSGVRWTMVLCVSILGLLLIGVIILGILSVADVIHGHPGAAWLHFTAWLQSNLWWLIGGPLVALVVFKIVLPVHETRAHTAVERAEAARIREETRHLREARYHNEEHMPQGYIALPNALGNYGQVIPDGQVTAYLLPGNSPTGNSGVNPKLLLDVMARQQQQVVDGDGYAQEEEEEGFIQAAQIHIPTFRESLVEGLIGPGQEQMLLCHVLEQDEETTGLFTGSLLPYQDLLENNSTLFMGGSSKSGKSTYIAHIGAQGALMNALYYVIDPHLTHPDKSIAKKLEALSHAFILPPARTESEIFRVLQHARGVAQCRKDGKETPYGDRIIFFIVDEVLAVMNGAHRSTNKETILMYADLARFMRELGTEYNKFGVNGIFASQYVTKDAFKLPAPAGNIDFRDGCQNQILLKLPPNQAQAMRLIDSSELRGVRHLPQGHGYMGIYTGEVLRMAMGYVSRQDIEYVASLAAPSPDQRKLYAVPASTGAVQEQYRGGTRSLEQEEGTFAQEKRQDPLNLRQNAAGSTHSTGALQMPLDPLPRRSVPGTDAGTEPVLAGTDAVPGTDAGTEQVPAFKKRFTNEQEVAFFGFFDTYRSIKRALSEMHVSYGDYQTYASWLVRHYRQGESDGRRG